MHTESSPDEFFERLAEVRAQQIWAGMGERRAPRKWARMSASERDGWVRGLIESGIAGWTRLTPEERASWRELVAHLQSFQQRYGIVRSCAPWPLSLLQTAQADFVEWREGGGQASAGDVFAPRDDMQRAADAAMLNQLASMRHDTAMSTIRNIR
jgi:hypothetical protein